MRALFRMLGVLPALVIAGCVTSKTSLLSADSRVLPFLPGTQFEVYERDDPRQPWRKNASLSTFLADDALIVRQGDERGEVKDESTYSFHSVGFERFLVQARFKHETRYS